jgi:hypothetical protein
LLGTCTPITFVRSETTTTTNDMANFQHWASVPADERAYALHEAWWGKDITPRTISGPSDPDGVDFEPLPPQNTVLIDHNVGGEMLGEILIREEYTIALNFIQRGGFGTPRKRSGSHWATRHRSVKMEYRAISRSSLLKNT